MDLNLDTFFELQNPSPDQNDTNNDLSELIKTWISERTAPEILPCQTTLLDKMMQRIQQQISFLIILIPFIKLTLQTELIELKIGQDIKTNFRMILIQTEIERIKYIIRSYLQTRIYKLDKYGIYILQTPECLARLSSIEIEYLKKHQDILMNYYTSAVLKHLPKKLQRLDDTQGGVSMIEKPDLDRAIFCRVINTVEQDIPISRNETITLNKGNIYLLKYRIIRSFLRTGDVELI
ncbi:hypothetical protein T552_01419 [Pneumocystis carinii B80]|uniref:DNA replication complex GINS protein SLD5 n=1 Tax=Pneumocystis carinii (strain B80) TaxID=1408658 RepID=A0A0W4ZK98_PNEC8|nr:hypothetical protein T552_01419 [Pneumocystis carinii B80]KTW28789.1 hypothetical protein T552_01419 [Pneumocystis carinii B80]